MDKLDPSNLTATDYKTLANNGLKDSDLFDYKASLETPTPSEPTAPFNQEFAREYDTFLKDPTKIPSRYKTKQEQEQFIKEANAYASQKPT